MDHTALIAEQTTARVVVPADAAGDKKHRLAKFAAWLDAKALPWHAPDLAAYRDHLLASLTPASVAAHLSTVRARYAALIRDDARRDELYSLAGEHLQALDQATRPQTERRSSTNWSPACRMPSIPPLHPSRSRFTKTRLTPST